MTEYRWQAGVGAYRSLRQRATIYFLQVQAEGPIKIGCSDDPSRRLKELAAWFPFDLKIVATIDASIWAEKALHAHFKDYRIRGEWFEPHDALTHLIEFVKERAVLPSEIEAATRVYVRKAQRAHAALRKREAARVGKPPRKPNKYVRPTQEELEARNAKARATREAKRERFGTKVGHRYAVVQTPKEATT